MIPPQVNGATPSGFTNPIREPLSTFPMIPPQVNGATTTIRATDQSAEVVSNDSAPS